MGWKPVLLLAGLGWHSSLEGALARKRTLGARAQPPGEPLKSNRWE